MSDGEREPFDDERLARLLAAGRAPRDPATLARALARVRAEEREPAWLAWLGRPVALAAAALLLVVSVGAGVWYGGVSARSTVSGSVAAAGSSDLLGSLLADEGGVTVTTGGANDSGGVQ